jgi:uncharacterized membrane protein SirB2
MNYLVLKQAHVALALLSISGFIVRWNWKRTGHRLAAAKAVRILPHLVDTLLLAAGIALALAIGQYPLTHGWLTFKIGGLLLYILLGMVAMRSTPGSCRSVTAFVAAVMVFAWIASIARSKSAWGFIAWLGGGLGG